MGLLLGSLVGGALSGGLIIVGGTLAASGLAAPIIIATPLAAVVLGMATALGAAMFGEDFGRDFLDAMLVALACSVISVAVVVTLFYLAPATLGLMVGTIAALIFPAVATPLFVQAFKSGDPQPTIALARF